MHEWMIKPLPQSEWIERQGMLVWIAEVFTSLGAGLYLVSLFFDNLVGMLVAWLIITFLKIPPHILYLGKPLRFYRLIPPFTSAWKTSWYARGIIFTVMFTSFGALQLIVSYFLPGTGWDITLKVLTGISAFLIGIYSGFIMNYCRSIPFWNSALVPLVFIFAGIADGFALIMAIGLAGAQVNMVAAEIGSRWLLILNTLIIAVYLWSQTYTSSIAKYSVLKLIKGNLAPVFWVGLILLGIVIPLVISIASIFTGEASTSLLIIAVVCHTAGAFALKYCLLKVGIHNPLLPSTTSASILNS